jgi:hypothetical protein
MSSLPHNMIGVLFGIALLIAGFILLISGINTTSMQITNVYYLGIGIIVMIGGLVIFKKL